MARTTSTFNTNEEDESKLYCFKTKNIVDKNRKLNKFYVYLEKAKKELFYYNGNATEPIKLDLSGMDEQTLTSIISAIEKSLPLNENHKKVLEDECKKGIKPVPIDIAPIDVDPQLKVWHTDLSKCPRDVIPHKPGEKIVFGDEHGYAVNPIHLLMLHEVFERDEAIVLSCAQALEDNERGIDNNNHHEFVSALEKIKKTEHADQIDLLWLGDILSERRGNDWFNLNFFATLDRLGIKPENSSIIMSNHDIEFVREMERIIALKNSGQAIDLDDCFTRERFNISKDQVASSLRLGKLLREGKVQLDDVINLYEKHYKPRLKIIEYNLDEQGLTYYTHARSPKLLMHIKLLAKQFDVQYKDDTKEDLAMTIEWINHNFQEKYVKTNTISTLYDIECLKDISSEYEKNKEINILAKEMMLKKYLHPKYAMTLALNNRLSLPEDEDLVVKKLKYIVKAVHGHDTFKVEVRPLFREFIFNDGRSYGTILDNPNIPEDELIHFLCNSNAAFFRKYGVRRFFAYTDNFLYVALENNQNISQYFKIPMDNIIASEVLLQEYARIRQKGEKELEEKAFDSSTFDPIELPVNIMNILLSRYPDLLDYAGKYYSCLDNPHAKTRGLEDGLHLYHDMPKTKRVELRLEDKKAWKADPADINLAVEEISDFGLFADMDGIQKRALDSIEEFFVGDFNLPRYPRGTFDDYIYGPENNPQQNKITKDEITEQQKKAVVLIDEENFLAHLPPEIDQKNKTVQQLYVELISLRDYCIKHSMPLPDLTALLYAPISSPAYLMMSSLPFGYREFVKEEIHIVTAPFINLNCKNLPGNAVELGYVKVKYPDRIPVFGETYDLDGATLTDKFVNHQYILIDNELNALFQSQSPCIAYTMSGTGHFAGKFALEAKQHYAENFIKSFLKRTEGLELDNIPHIYFSANDEEFQLLSVAIFNAIKADASVKERLSHIRMVPNSQMSIVSELQRQGRGPVALKVAGDLLGVGGHFIYRKESAAEETVANRTTMCVTQDSDLNPYLSNPNNILVLNRDSKQTQTKSISIEELEADKGKEKWTDEKSKLASLIPTEQTLQKVAKLVKVNHIKKYSTETIADLLNDLILKPTDPESPPVEIVLFCLNDEDGIKIKLLHQLLKNSIEDGKKILSKVENNEFKIINSPNEQSNGVYSANKNTEVAVKFPSKDSFEGFINFMKWTMPVDREEANRLYQQQGIGIWDDRSNTIYLTRDCYFIKSFVKFSLHHYMNDKNSETDSLAVASYLKSIFNSSDKTFGDFFNLNNYLSIEILANNNLLSDLYQKMKSYTPLTTPTFDNDSTKNDKIIKSIISINTEIEKEIDRLRNEIKKENTNLSTSSFYLFEHPELRQQRLQSRLCFLTVLQIQIGYSGEKSLDNWKEEIVKLEKLGEKKGVLNNAEIKSILNELNDAVHYKQKPKPWYQL